MEDVRRRKDIAGRTHLYVGELRITQDYCVIFREPTGNCLNTSDTPTFKIVNNLLAGLLYNEQKVNF